MSDLAIRVENLSKLYRIGLAGKPRYETLYDKIAGAGAHLLSRLRQPFHSQSDIRNSNSEFIWALKDVSFEVKRGEVVGIIGRNGAGKSTLLKILSRITEPTEGRAEVYGRVGSLLEVGTGFHPELTGRENIYLNGAILGMRKAEIDRKFDEIVAFAEIEKFIDTPVKFYSSGMYVRLAFAVAAHLDPEILLVDEVLAVGDAAFQKKCLGKMGEVAGEGRTVLFVSHNMAAIESLCPRALCLSAGAILADGPVNRVVPLYLTYGLVNNALFDVELKEHPGRRPNMRPVLSRLSLRNANSQAGAFFRIGDTLVFNIELDPDGACYQSPSVSITILNMYGIQLCKLATWAKPIQWQRLVSRACVECVWPDCRLAPGRYYVNVGFGNGGFTVDYVEAVLAFDIASTDVYGTGKIGTGVFIPEYEWRVLENAVSR